MDRASSRFVDQLVLEKMVSEKLSRVRHRPAVAPDALLDPVFDHFGGPLVAAPRVHGEQQPDVVILPSPMETPGFPENSRVPLRVYPVAAASGAILLVHGLFEDNREIYGFLIGELNRRGYSVYLTTLPYHYERAPAHGLFSGEYFLSADLGRTKQAFTQAVLELRQCHDWISTRQSAPAYVVGFSMGGTVALAAAGVSEALAGVVAVNPAAKLCEVIETSPLCATIKRDLVAAGWRTSDIRDVLATFDPYMAPRPIPRIGRCLVIYALYDLITRPCQYEALVEKWQFPNVIRYKAGHLNTLRVPRFAADVTAFFEGLGRDRAVSRGGAHG